MQTIIIARMMSRPIGGPGPNGNLMDNNKL